MVRFRALACVSTAGVLLVGLAGCGGSDAGSRAPSPSKSAAADHNAADVKFASETILHHQQAAQLASTAGYQGSGSVKKLAATLDVARATEVKELSALLTEWGVEIPKPAHNHEEALPGMLTEDDWSETGRAEGPAFDLLWLRLMIRHHQGAVTMARAQQTAGQNPAAVALAQKLQSSQAAEIAVMQQSLRRLAAR